ncbi:MAG TPA: carboxypeptidase regulatory-like domain-containing protein [Pyrinomonadaceae bacterium]
MRYPTLVLTLLFLVSLSPAASFQNPQQTPAKPLYAPTGNEATLTGTITANGEIPKAQIVDLTADPLCELPNGEKYETDFLLTNNQRLLNVFVYVKGGETLNAYRFETPKSEVVLERKNCRFSPHVLGIRVGQSLSIVNNDRTQHNTHPVPKINQEWNASQAAGTSFSQSFKRPELFIPVKCNQHPWEKAYLSVMAHPFFAVSDAFGNYEIRGLPPGRYKLVAWHEAMGEQETEITVAAGENRRLDFTFESLKVGSRLE